MYHCMQNIPCL